MSYKHLFFIFLFAFISQIGYSQFIPLLPTQPTQQTQQQIPTVEINPNRITYGDARLSDIIESIEYIPLETTDDVLIGGITTNFDISDNYIVLVCNHQGQVFLFSRDGRFINRVGRLGQGPGEYSGFIGNVLIDEERDRILVGPQYSRGFLVYNLRGEFTGNMPIDRRGGMIHRFFNDHFFIHNLFESPFSYEIRDIDFQLKAEGIKNGLYGHRSPFGISGPANYLFNDKMHVRPWHFNDTIFSIGNDFSFTPQFVVTAGRRTVSLDLLTADTDRFFRRSPGYVSFAGIYQTANKLLVSYRFQGKRHFAYFDKNAERLFHFRSETGIPNDFDGGISFWPARQDNLLLSRFFHAYYLIENSGGITPVGGTEAVQNFNRLIERLDEDDNPVLVIVRLRGVGYN